MTISKRGETTVNESEIERVVRETIENDLRHAPIIDETMVARVAMTKLGRERVLVSGGREHLKYVARMTLKQLYGG